ncbi:MAG: FIST C-terminal domain-containing protein [Campylobacterales bacterium]|nr:FIST C-terminal domain-containing protein [Campylobacterales bacterium]
MKTLSIVYESDHHLELFMKREEFRKNENVLIQVFTSVVDTDFIINLRKLLIAMVPQAKIIGTTTCGEISNEGALNNSTVITFTVLKATKIEVVHCNLENDSFQLGQNIVNQFSEVDASKLKLIITFTDGLHTNGERYLDGISSVDPKIVVCGGMAGDNAMFEKTYVFSNDFLTSKGAVAVALFNENLNVYTDYSFNWETVGKQHTVTNSNENRVYNIGALSAIDFYKHYLGEDIEKLLPIIGIEFPLVIKKDGMNIARAVIAKHDDGSLSFAGNIPQGSQIQFGYGDVQMIINKGLNSVKNIIESPVEAIFIYSCMARRVLLKQDVNLEILPLRELGPISGFFTYGEFYHNCNNDCCNSQLLNQSMTIVAISEKNNLVDKVSPSIFSANPPNVDVVELHRTQALSVLIKRTTKELEELNLQLAQKVEDEVEKNRHKDSLMHVMQTQAQLGDMIEMIIHQWRQPLSAITSSVSSCQVYHETGIMDDTILENTLQNILNYVEHLNSTISDFRDLFKTNIQKEKIFVDTLITKTLTIVEPIVKKTDIKIITNIQNNFNLTIPVGLMMQVLLNIIKNAIDVLLEREIKQPSIQIVAFEKDNMKYLQIKDNAGGIPEQIIDKIFDKKFTTKDASNGTGLGLNMSKTILENKVDASLEAQNDNDGAVFTIKF